MDLIHFIGQCLIEHRDGKDITLLHFVQTGKKPGARQSTVTGQNRVGTLSSDRKTGALQMSDRDLEYRFICAMIQRQIDADGRNLDLADHPILGQVQE